MDWAPGITLSKLDYLYTIWGDRIHCVDLGGVAHATNLIDGLNGLAMGVCMLIAGWLAFLAYAVGDTVILNVSILLMCSILGLFVFNFPFGKIFLGDAGAYTLGHVLISPYAILLIFFLADHSHAICDFQTRCET